MKRTAIRLLAAGCVMAISVGAGWAQNGADPLKSGFKNPPESAKPRVWWHWMNGNITKDGIKLDEEWMHRVGIGGFQNFDAQLGTPQVVKQRLAYMTPEWKDAFKYATVLADQLGFEEAIAGSPGWSESGGPWVPASHGMKKYVWSETRVEGGEPFTGTLPHPPTETGIFQNLQTHEWSASKLPKFYADSKVIAYKVPASEVAADAMQPTITWSSGNIDPALLSDGDMVKMVLLPKAPEGEKAWIQFEYPQPQTIRSITYVVGNDNPPRWGDEGTGNKGEAVEASDDGQNFHVVASLSHSDAPENTIEFSPETAKYFRVTFKTMPPSTDDDDDSNSRTPSKNVRIAELVLHPDARVNDFESKAAFDIESDLYGFATPPVAPSEAIQKSDVIDLTSRMHPDGTLDWTPPPGEWEVIRFGYSLIGTTNHPATAEATGLEVDKLNRADVKDYFEKYLDSYKETVGPDLMGKRGIRYVINDSYEAGAQNWTDNMIADFTRLRGYDPTPWLPVLTGRVVVSSEASDRFLWDFRRTLSDLMAEEHYHTLEEVLHEWGMGHYGESHEGGRALIADGMEVKKWNEVPMSAMWTQTPGVNHVQYDYNADDRESASVAHIYGQNLAAAESMTAAEAPWGWSPATLKPTADQEFINGINRIVIHESAHQPLIGKAPGLSLGPYGQWFNRNETWAEQAGPWISYLARTSFMLQQGRFGADLIYFYGEDSNLTAIFNEKSPDVPAGFGFDYVNADALIHALSVADGRIKTPGGMSYRLLGLDPYSRHMSLPVLRAIRRLVEDGASVAGPKPIDDPSLADDQAEFTKLNDELFGDGTGTHKVGKGTVYAGQNLGDVFTAMNVKPDFDYTKPDAQTHLEFVHRKTADGDLYFVDNRSDNAASVDATFRVAGKAPELWRAENGSSEPSTYTIADGRTTVPLKLEPWGTVFVVFRKPTGETSFTAPEKTETQLATVEGPWTVSFEVGRGAPPSITLDTLSSWSENHYSGVKYFSGAGTYTKAIDASADWFKNGAHVWIDLGSVKNLAEVTVNGKSLGIVWHAPYRVDATTALKPGANEVKIIVINAWVNRLIGDMQPDATTKYTFTTSKPYKADSPLQLSGLLGPVNVYSVTTK
ncbi:MAG: glycosyl hydrolase [Terracidiphilus sp.]